MFEYDDRAVIEMGTVIRESVHDAIEGRAHQCSGGGKQIHAEMNGAMLGRGPDGCFGVAFCSRISPESRRSVERTRLVVSANAYRYTVAPHLAENRIGHGGQLGVSRVGPKKSAANA